VGWVLQNHPGFRLNARHEHTHPSFRQRNHHSPSASCRDLLRARLPDHLGGLAPASVGSRMGQGARSSLDLWPSPRCSRRRFGHRRTLRVARARGAHPQVADRDRLVRGHHPRTDGDGARRSGIIPVLIGGSWGGRAPNRIHRPDRDVVPPPFIRTLTDGLGEEVGWRGFALPRMLAMDNAVTAIVVLGGAVGRLSP
jgi:hypothetical protein